MSSLVCHHFNPKSRQVGKQQRSDVKRLHKRFHKRPLVKIMSKYFLLAPAVLLAAAANICADMKLT